jgi:dipeptidyl aminopeptidase/acylaminoacyl peptidase
MVTGFLLLLTWGRMPGFSQDMLELYKKAEKFLPGNTEKLIFRMEVKPHWLSPSPLFWYSCKTRRGKEFIRVDPLKKTKKPAFDQQKMAGSLTRLLGKACNANDLPLDSLRFSPDMNSMTFRSNGQVIRCDLKTYTCRKIKKQPWNPLLSVSPDGKWEVFIRDHNLVLRSRKTKKEVPLTTDGTAGYGYGSALGWDQLTCVSDPQKTESFPRLQVKWSPDSTKLSTRRVDYRKARKLYLFQSSPPDSLRARVWSYYRALPGEAEGALFEYYIFDIINRKKTRVDLKPLHYTETGDDPAWFRDSRRLYTYYFSRGYQTVQVIEIDALTGKTRPVMNESTRTYIDFRGFFFSFTPDEREFIWSSRRDGWNHLYLFDWQSGKLKSRITRGEFTVREFLAYDDSKRRLYFLASGRESGQDPYYQQLYRVNPDGTGLRLLTPEKAEHRVSLSPDKQFVVDTYSRVNLPPITVLRRLVDGKVILELERADIRDLLAIGWTFPEAFKAKARDGKTDIYGLMIRPIDFDPEKKYPVIDSSYSTDVLTPKSFDYGCLSSNQALAQLGFIMVVVDGLGTPFRAREFREFSYKNLGDSGSPDHIAAMKQLAGKYPYMDLSRVGIRGHSTGGFNAAHALLAHPEFYRVGVSSAGNHDFEMGNAWFTEMFMGYPVGNHYTDQSNLTLAKNLRGKLLLVYQEMDSNVNPASTLRLAAELIKANRDFDLLFLPNAGHGAVMHPYFTRKTWDYFVRHLLGKEPPPQYRIKSLANARELPQ